MGVRRETHKADAGHGEGAYGVDQRAYTCDGEVLCGYLEVPEEIP